MTKNVFAFSGQGSQYYGMGEALYKKGGKFRQCFDQADEIIRGYWNSSLSQQLYDPKKGIKDALEDIRISHPALFVVQYGAAMEALEMCSPDALFGVSLGELVAMTVGGVWSFETGLRFVLKQVDWLLEGVPEGQFILALEAASVLDHALHLLQDCYTHAVPGRRMSILSIKPSCETHIEHCLSKQNISFQRLPVRYPFHSPWIEPLKSRCLSYLESLSFSPPQLPLISSALQAVVYQYDPHYVWEIVRAPASLEQTLLTCVDTQDRLIDCSPSGTIKAWSRMLDSPSSKRSDNVYEILSLFKTNVMHNLQQLSQIAK